MTTATSPTTGGGRPASPLPSLADFTPAQAAPGEEVLVRYTRGTGSFSLDKRFINLDMEMFLPDGTPDGYHQGVWEAIFTSPAELLRVPPQPARPFDVPVGPIPVVAPNAETKGVWAFADGSSITAVGPAVSTLTPRADGSFLFMVATTQWIVEGTGRYEGARGLKSSLGSTYIPPGLDIFGPDPVQFTATTIETMRVMPASGIGELGGVP